jgi:hypothetical protein
VKVGCVAIATLLGLAAPSHADPSQDAKRLAADGDFIGAAAKFREAYAATGSPELVCNVGVAYYKASDLPRAHRYLHQCQQVGSSLDRSFMQQVTAVLQAVEGNLATGDFTPVEITVEPASATAKITVVDGRPHDDAFEPGQVLWFPHGTYQVLVAAPGYAGKRSALTVNGHQRVTLHVKLDEAAKDIEFAATGATTRVSSKRRIAYISGGAGVVLGLGAVYFGLRARSIANDVESACAIDCDWPLVSETDASGRRARTTALVLSGLGTAALVTGAVFFLLDNRERNTSVTVVPRQGGAYAAWTCSW